jgi:murein DD-endopeptidase MepM/ murein hydrolase activator NlpD
LRFGYLRAAVYATVVLATAVALTFIPALPDSRPAEVFFSQAAAPSWMLKHDTLDAGEKLHRVLQRSGLSDTAAIRAIQASSEKLDLRKVPAGMPITVRSDNADSAPSVVEFKLGVDKILRMKRDGEVWVAAEERLKWTTDTILVSGTIKSNLYAAIDEAAADFLPDYARIQLTNKLANVYEFKVDMSRELQKGDEFRVLAVRSMLETGTMRVDSVLATSFDLSGSVIKAVRFNSAKVGGDFFDENGKSMREAFLRAPIEFGRISSVFGSRRHPILGSIRNHKGTDYAAASGTPIRAIGDGTVIRAGWGGGYGNMIEIRHPNGFVTRYGHMKSFAKGIRGGSRVKMGEYIGYVGTTGLSTGPHLHFEVLIGGQQRDSRQAFNRNRGTGDPVPKSEVDAFQRIRDQLLPTLDRVSVNTAITLQGTAARR